MHLVHNKKIDTTKGFTLTELIIVLAIFLILSVVVLFNGSSSFTDSIALRQSADKIVLAYRQAQVEGLAVRENPNSANDFNVGYGIHLEAGPLKNAFVYFMDSTIAGVGNNTYDGVFPAIQADCMGKCLQRIELNKKVHIQSITGRSPLDVVFKRPRPKVIMTTASGNTDEVVVTLQATGGGTATVSIKAPGNISVTYSSS